jgi:hypothetical protein
MSAIVTTNERITSPNTTDSKELTSIANAATIIPGKRSDEKMIPRQQGEVLFTAQLFPTSGVSVEKRQAE